MTLKGALVGFGEVASNGHWPGYRAQGGAEIVAVVDRMPERRALAEKVIPGVTTYESLAEIPASSGVNFADICTPPSLHAEPMFEAIDRGWHVLCEKPFLLDPVALDRARVKALSAGVAVIPVHNWKYAPIVRGATDALRAGAIGTLTHVEIETSRLKAAPTAQPGGVNWRRDPSIAGGGILMDHGWHSVYIALHWFNTQASGVRAALHHAADPSLGGVEDEARVTIQFPAGEAIILLTWNGTARRNAMRLDGTGGSIIAADDVLEVRGKTPRTTQFESALSAGSAHADWFEAMLPDVLDGFRHPERSRPMFEEAAQTLAIIQQAYGFASV
ncbi:MAG TPA: Gfo/Idh/MocA family oxidoreductase [Vicinamibacterales bacterium]|jgi:predicted dehydrogenase|nr:Gfo/Idh/MocA family oxidoreductase [Vicinamibacterales bacterium]